MTQFCALFLGIYALLAPLNSPLTMASRWERPSTKKKSLQYEELILPLNFSEDQKEKRSTRNKS